MSDEDNKMIEEHNAAIDAEVLTPEAKPPEEAMPVAEAPPSINLEELRKEFDQKLSSKDQELHELKANFEMLRARPQQHQEPKTDEFGNLSEDDLITAKDFRRILDTREIQYKEAIEEMQIASRFPDYQETIQKYLPQAIRDNPLRKAFIESSPNKAMAAYDLAKLYAGAQVQQQQAAPPQSKSKDAERIVANSQKPGSINSAGGMSTQSQANFYANMSDDDFMKVAQQNLAEI